MAKTWTIRYGSEFWLMHEDGCIERPGLVQPTDSCRGLGAIGDKLTKLAKTFSIECYIGNDGDVYLS